MGKTGGYPVAGRGVAVSPCKAAITLRDLPMSTTDPSTQPAMSDSSSRLIVYILYFAGYITGITKLIGVIIAHFKIKADADPLLRTRITSSRSARSDRHIAFMIGTVLLFVVVGFAVWLRWFIWSLVRRSSP